MRITGLFLGFSNGIMLALMMCVSSPASAATITMLDITGTGARNFSDPTIWPSDVVPGTADLPVVDFGDGTSDYVYIDSATTIARFNVGNFVSGGLEIRNGATLTTTATGNSQSNLGQHGIGQIRIKSGATLSQGGLLNLGLNEGTATLTLENGGSHTLGAQLVVGGAGTGTYNMLGGSLTAGAYVQVGTSATANGAFQQSSGTVQINRVSATGKGLLIASAAGGTGLYEISGGSLTVADSNTGMINGSTAVGGGGVGTFRIIGSAPTITIGTHFEQRPGAKLELQIGATGISPINVSGNSILDGILGVSFTATPTIGQEFTLMNYGGTLTGTFATFDDLVDGPAGPNSVKLSINYGALSASSIVVTVVSPAVPGDFDSDGDVDGADFVAWQTNFPKASSALLAEGDADADGDVDGADFVVWQTNFPFTPGPAVTPVPEPSASSLILTGLAAACFGRLRRRRHR